MFFKEIKKFYSRLRRPKRYWQIFWLISRIKPHRIMEIGTWTGDRALTMIKLSKRYYSAKEIEYYGFDLFGQMTMERFTEEKSKWPPTQQEVHEKLSASGANIHLFQGNTIEVLPDLIVKLPKMDLLFIDGGHSLETIASDWNLSKNLMHSKSVLIFDDYWPGRTDAGCKLTVDGIDRYEYDVKLLPITDRFDNTDFGRLVIKLVKVTIR